MDLQNIIIPTYKISQTEIGLSITAEQYQEIQSGLELLRKKRDISRKHYANKKGTSPKAIKPTYVLGKPEETQKIKNTLQLKTPGTVTI